MQLSVKGKQIDVGDALRQHVEIHLKDTVGKYFAGTLDATVTFSREAHLYRADITVHAGRNIVLQSNASSSEPYPAFDMAAERMEERLRRYKTKLKGHHQDVSPKEESLVAQSFVLNPEEKTPEGEAPDNPVVVAEMTTPIEILSVGEAVMRLDLGELPALMFRSRSTGAMNMIYRRPDGNIGWVDSSQMAVAARKAHG